MGRAGKFAVVEVQGVRGGRIGQRRASPGAAADLRGPVAILVAKCERPKPSFGVASIAKFLTTGRAVGKKSIGLLRRSIARPPQAAQESGSGTAFDLRSRHGGSRPG
jgi:hypothetical protein